MQILIIRELIAKQVYVQFHDGNAEAHTLYEHTVFAVPFELAMFSIGTLGKNCYCAVSLLKALSR